MKTTRECITVEITVPVTITIQHHTAYKGIRIDGLQYEPDEEAGSEIMDIEPESDSTWREIIEAEVERLHALNELEEA